MTEDFAEDFVSGWHVREFCTDAQLLTLEMLAAEFAADREVSLVTYPVGYVRNPDAVGKLHFMCPAIDGKAYGFRISKDGSWEICATLEAST